MSVKVSSLIDRLLVRRCCLCGLGFAAISQLEAMFALSLSNSAEHYSLSAKSQANVVDSLLAESTKRKIGDLPKKGFLVSVCALKSQVFEANKGHLNC